MVKGGRKWRVSPGAARRLRVLAATAALAALVVLVAPVGASPSFAAPRCPKASPGIEIDVGLDPGAVAYDKGKSKKTLTKMAAGPGVAGSQAGTRFGLTRSAYSEQIKIGVRSEEIGDGWRCHRLSSISARIEISELSVYVARELPSGTCAYKAVLEHEARHVSILRDTLRDYLPAYEKALRRAAEGIDPIADKARKIPGDRFFRHLKTGLKPVLAELSETLKKRQKAIDTPEEYRRVHQLCREW